MKLSFTPLKYTMGVSSINGHFSLGILINLKLIYINTRHIFVGVFFPPKSTYIHIYLCSAARLWRLSGTEMPFSVVLVKRSVQSAAAVKLRLSNSTTVQEGNKCC